MGKSKARKLDPQLKQGVTAAYKLGLMDGEKVKCRQCRNRLVSALTTTNASLWEILNDLDKTEPIQGIILSFKEAQEVVVTLREANRKPKLRNIIARRVRESSHSLEKLLAELVGTT